MFICQTEWICVALNQPIDYTAEAVAPQSDSSGSAPSAPSPDFCPGFVKSARADPYCKMSRFGRLLSDEIDLP